MRNSYLKSFCQLLDLSTSWLWLPVFCVKVIIFEIKQNIQWLKKNVRFIFNIMKDPKLQIIFVKWKETDLWIWKCLTKNNLKSLACIYISVRESVLEKFKGYSLQQHCKLWAFLRALIISSPGERMDHLDRWAGQSWRWMELNQTLKKTC